MVVPECIIKCIYAMTFKSSQTDLPTEVGVRVCGNFHCSMNKP